MRSLIKLSVVIAIMLFLAPSAYADGTLQYSTCGTEEILDIGGSPVAVGSLVQLWDTNTNQIIDSTQIGNGIINTPPGRFAANVSLPDGNYNLKIRVYNTASPDGSPSTCAVVVGGSGRGSAGINVTISAGSPQSVCFNSAQIPDQSYVSGVGGCSAPSAVQLQSFSAASVPYGTSPMFVLGVLAFILGSIYPLSSWRLKPLSFN